ncbi:MAG: nucleotidyl transferase AbiEii/AbiGii toxin family protein, partial [Deltaproteobacteria bacterium]|nr:nucleotidyl transferase AbiEii/AbiGii toxin family protein [Deltaproteobacteria bacterium]
MSDIYDIQARFFEALSLIQEAKLEYVLCGGLAASQYRDQPRLTADIDFIVRDEPKSRASARKIITTMGLKPHELRKADLDGGPLFAIEAKSTPVQVFVGRKPEDKRAIGIDFLLSNRLGAAQALTRGQNNLVDFGSTKVPMITIEDLIVAKLVAARPKDVDDLVSIFSSHPDFDIPYLSGQLEELSILIPTQVQGVMPPALARFARKLS